MISLPLTALLLVQAPAATAATKAESPLDKIVCRRLEVTGSRVAGKRVCMTKREWNKTASRTSEEVANAIDRINPYSKVP